MRICNYGQLRPDNRRITPKNINTHLAMWSSRTVRGRWRHRASEVLLFPAARHHANRWWWSPSAPKTMKCGWKFHYQQKQARNAFRASSPPVHHVHGQRNCHSIPLESIDISGPPKDGTVSRIGQGLSSPPLSKTRPLHKAKIKSLSDCSAKTQITNVHISAN